MDPDLRVTLMMYNTSLSASPSMHMYGYKWLFANRNLYPSPTLKSTRWYTNAMDSTIIRYADQ